MSDASFLFLSQEDVIKSGGLDVARCMQDVAKVLVMRHRNQCIVPHKVVLRKGSQEEESKTGRINALPGYLGADIDVGGMKWVASFVQNPFQHNLPRSTSLIVLNSFQTGLPLAILDGTIISAMRTGAVAGVACQHLAPPETRTVGAVGAGVVNRTLLMAVKQACPTLRQVRIFDLAKDRAQSFATEMQQQLGVEVSVADSAQAAYHDADVLVTATPSKRPYLKADWVRKGTLYLHMSGYECEFDVVKQSDKVVFDNWEDVRSRASQTPAIMYEQGLFKDSDVHAEIAQIITGERPGRENPEERILFCPVGMGIQDLIVAHRIYETAKAHGYGQRLKLWETPMWM